MICPGQYCLQYYVSRPMLYTVSNLYRLFAVQSDCYCIQSYLSRPILYTLLFIKPILYNVLFVNIFNCPGQYCIQYLYTSTSKMYIVCCPGQYCVLQFLSWPVAFGQLPILFTLLWEAILKKAAYSWTYSKRGGRGVDPFQKFWGIF